MSDFTGMPGSNLFRWRPELTYPFHDRDAITIACGRLWLQRQRIFNALNLRESLGAEGGRAAHAATVRAIPATCDRIWSTLPASHTYRWRFLVRHRRGAGQTIGA